MRDRILKELKKIEEKENVKIIMAIESGSRTWCFASSDSGYAVCFIYEKKTENYLKPEDVRDVIEWCAYPIRYIEHAFYFVHIHRSFM